MTSALPSDAMPSRPAAGQAIAAVIGQLREKGFDGEATALEQHLARFGQGPFYQALDSWLGALAFRSPETFEHITRQAVLLALCAETMTQGMPAEQRKAYMVSAFFAGAAHDVGKLAIDPALLHKSTRLDRGTLETLLAQYQQRVPDYDGKYEDMEFLRMMNGGRIPVDGKRTSEDIDDVRQIIARVNADPLLGEPRFADDKLVFSSAVQFEAIRAMGMKYGVEWLLPEQETLLLNDGCRGTLSREEVAQLAEHDPIGVAMLKKVGIPPELGFMPEAVDLRPGTNAALANAPEMAKLSAWLKLSDIFEATTGQRAYNRENGKNLTVAEATKVLEHAAQNGDLAPQVVEQFKAAGIGEKYAALYRDIPKDRTRPQPVAQAQGAELGTALTPDTGKGLNA